MEDPTGLTCLADSKLLNKAYDDLLAGAMKEGGQALADTVKAFRLFTAPIQLLVVAQDRLKAFCEKVRQRVPEERHVEAPPSIALPVLLSLRYMEDDNPLTELFLNLLARAIDKERQGEAHPAFVRIIEQMSPDEAMLIHLLRENHACFRFPLARRDVAPSDAIQYGAWHIVNAETDFPIQRLANPGRSFMYFDHLRTLNLVEQSPGSLRSPIPERTYYLTEFGRFFLKACVPDDFELPESGCDHTDSER